MRQVHRAAAGHAHVPLTGPGMVAGVTAIALAGSMLLATAPRSSAASGSWAAPGTLRSGVGIAAVSLDVQPAVVRSLDVPVSRGSLARAGAAVVAELERTPVSTYGLVGVTWEPGTAAKDTRAWIRTRIRGTWGPWTHLGGCTCAACRASRAEDPDSEIRVGTAPTWVGAADGVAVRVTSSSGRLPSDLTVDTIEPDRTPLAPGVGVSSAQRLPTGFPAKPNVVTRKQWGADPALGDQCSDPKYGSAARAVVVHHTVNSNSYSAADSPALMRSILAYHTQSQGWCDVGYNFVVDRYGTVFEGRRGGLHRPVRGAHAGNYNTDTVGVAMLGNFDVGKLPPALKDAMVRLVGWRLATSYVPARGRTKMKIYDKRLRRIVGHRDVMSTACPGRYGYKFLTNLRERAGELVSQYDSPIKVRADQLGAQVTGPVFESERSARGGLRTEFANGGIFQKRGLGAHWLKGASRQAYARFGGVYGSLGFPKTDARKTAVRGVGRINFEGGSIYRVGKKRAYLIRGRIMLRYNKRGGVGGRLGVPTTTQKSDGPRDKVTFEHGRIVLNRETGAINVIFS